jgi:hypothetical protein
VLVTLGSRCAKQPPTPNSRRGSGPCTGAAARRHSTHARTHARTHAHRKFVVPLVRVLRGRFWLFSQRESRAAAEQGGLSSAELRDHPADREHAPGQAQRRLDTTAAGRGLPCVAALACPWKSGVWINTVSASGRRGRLLTAQPAASWLRTRSARRSWLAGSASARRSRAAPPALARAQPASGQH